MDEIYSRNPDVVFRKIAGEFILVPIRQKAVDLKSVFTLNEPAAFLWELMDGKTSFSRIKDKFTEEFDVDAAQAEVDLSEITAQLESLGLIKKS